MYSRNYSLGMSYLNRFVIDEENQFECDGVFGLDDLSTQDILRDKSHVFIAADFVLASNRRILRTTMKPRSINLMITCLGSERLECVQKREHEKFYRGEGQIKYYHPYNGSPSILNVRESIGDEIEDFFQHIKKKTIDLNLKRLSRSDLRERLENAVKNFHLSMLTEEKQNEMLIQKNFDKKFPDFKNETILSEKEHNYALSVCFRKTFFQNEDNYYALIDPDFTALNLPTEEEYSSEEYWKYREQKNIPSSKLPDPDSGDPSRRSSNIFFPV